MTSKKTKKEKMQEPETPPNSPKKKKKEKVKIVYVDTTAEKLKAYRAKYYAEKIKGKVIRPNVTCRYCNYSSSNSNMHKHAKTKKHELNKQLFVQNKENGLTIETAPKY